MFAWFVKEQIEEEATASKIVEQLEMVGDDRTGLLIPDRFDESANVNFFLNRQQFTSVP